MARPSLSLRLLPLPALTLLCAGLSGPAAPAAAAEPQIERRIPPTGGIKVPVETRERLSARLAAIRGDLRPLASHALAHDIRALVKAVDYALRHDEFYAAADVKKAERVLGEARDRLNELQAGRHSWTRRRGLVVRGYASSIDGSAQPYGLEIPQDVDWDQPVPLYVWLHGRGDKTTDLHFIDQRLTRPGRIHPPGAIVVHPFGRHCVGFKSAGEIDVLEAVAHVQSEYNIDPDRIVLIGFSMGGAGAWHVGAHYADHWVAVSPGAGFAETALYNRLARADFPAWYEQKLWGLYDVPAYVRNLFNLPVIAYSGELDKQIQAARVMEEAFEREGRKLPHLIGPGMGHKYHPDTLADLLGRLDQAVQTGRDRRPDKVFLQTRTLRYGRMHWLQLLRLGEHWRDAGVDARLLDEGTIELRTRNVRRLRLQPFGDHRDATIRIDGQELPVPSSNQPLAEVTLDRSADRWRIAPPRQATERVALAKRPGLQGPIDDVFLEPFLVVTPGRRASQPAVADWMNFELNHFRERWRALFRGELREKRDDQVTDDDVARYHLVVWGDAASNSVLARAMAADNPALPIHWTSDSLKLGDAQFDATHHVPVFIYPNPLNPEKYLVCNSGPTFREGHDRTNSLQNPKLPDWAVLDISVPPSDTAAGRVASAGFFDEQWRWRVPRRSP